MAKDLELDKHNELHCRGKSCDSASHECGIKTRVWHTLFALELIIGGPQGMREWSGQVIDFESNAKQDVMSSQPISTQSIRKVSSILVALMNLSIEFPRITSR